MSLLSLLDRRVIIRRRAGTPNRDTHGNVDRVFSDSPPIPARRDQTAATEDDSGRDQQTETTRWTFPFSTWLPDADPPQSWQVGIAGRDRIDDDGEVWEVIGNPELMYRRRRPHHWEAIARRVEG